MMMLSLPGTDATRAFAVELMPFSATGSAAEVWGFQAKKPKLPSSQNDSPARSVMMAKLLIC